MAAAAVPILLSVGSTLVPELIKLVVPVVERVFGRKNGIAKKDAAQSVLIPLLEALQKAVPGLGAPNASDIGALIDSAVAELNKAGALTGPTTPLPTATPMSMNVIRGSLQMLQGASVILNELSNQERL